MRLFQQRRSWQATDPDNSRITKIAKCLQMVGTIFHIGWCASQKRVDRTIADRVQHGLMFGHRIDDRRCIALAKDQRAGRRDSRQIRHRIAARQTLRGIRSHVNRTIGIGKEAERHEARVHTVGGICPPDGLEYATPNSVAHESPTLDRGNPEVSVGSTRVERSSKMNFFDNEFV